MRTNAARVAITTTRQCSEIDVNKKPLTPQQELTQLANTASKINALSQIGQHPKADAILKAGYRAAAAGVQVENSVFNLWGLLSKWGHK